jgi:uncharacterized protein YceK
MMRRTIVLVIAALALAGCGTAASEPATTVVHRTTTTAPAVTTTTVSLPQAQTYLLAITDLPSGWSVDNANITQPTSCYSDPLTKVTSSSYAHVDFAQGGSLPELVQELAVFPSTTAAASAYHTITTTLNGCKSFSETVDTETIHGNLGVMSSPTYGSQSSAYDATLTIQGESVNQGFVVAQQGQFVDAVALGDIGSLDTDTLQGFVGQAMAKLPA